LFQGGTRFEFWANTILIDVFVYSLSGNFPENYFQTGHGYLRATHLWPRLPTCHPSLATVTCLQPISGHGILLATHHWPRLPTCNPSLATVTYL